MSQITYYDGDGNPLTELYQWDSDLTITVRGLSVPPIPAFHFCNRFSKVALVVGPRLVGNDLIADIPNILLQHPEPLKIYFYAEGNDEGYRTIGEITIPIMPREKPDDYEFEENIDYTSLEMINSRVSTMIEFLSEGAAESVAAEVVDIRTGYDGTVYQTAGDAVRALGPLILAATAGVDYITTPPVANNPDNNLKFVILDTAPPTRYNGYIYVILEQTNG